MENLTHFNNASYTFRYGIWMSDFVFSCILLMISLYLFVALVYHQIKVENFLIAKFFRLTLEKKYRALSKYTCIVIGLFSIIRCLCDIAVNFIEWNAVFFNDSVQPPASAGSACNVLSQASASALFCGNVFVYVYLWFRQSIFYVQSTLKVLYGNKIKAFSFFILVFYLVSGISLFIVYSILVQYALNNAGFCQIQENKNSDASYVQPLIAWITLSMVMQISLLGLFVYPLLKQATWNKNQQGMQSNRTLQKVKKAVILASVSLVTDICSLVSLALVYGKNTNNPSLLYDVNLAINHLVTIACFSFWRKLFWPWRVQCGTISFVAVDENSFVSQQRTYGGSSFRSAAYTAKA